MISSALQRLRTSLAAPDGYWRSIATLMSGTMGAQAVGIASMLILARLYSPAEFGAFAFFFAVAGLLALLGTGKYEAAIFLARSQSEAGETALLGIALATVVAVSVAVIGSAALYVRPDLMLDGAAPLIALYVATGVVSGAAVAAVTAFAVQRKDYASVSRARFGQALCAAGMNIGLGLAGFGLSGLIIGFLAGQFACILVLMLNGEFLHHARNATLSGITKRAHEHIRFPRFMLIGEAFNYVGTNFVSFVTPGNFGTAALGHYNLGQRVAALPIAIVGGAMGEIFRTSISPEHAKPEELTRNFWHTARRLALFGACMSAPLALAGPTLFELLFGAGWREAGVCMQILAPLVFAKLVASPLSATLALAGRQWQDAVLQLFFLVTAVAALAIGLWQRDFYVMVIALSVMHTLIYGIYFWASYEASQRLGRS